MGEEYEGEADVIVLTDEKGQEHEFELLEILQVGDREYAVVAPLDEDEEEDEDLEDGEAIILRVETDENGDRIFTDIEDDEEWQRVADAWDAEMEGEEWEDEGEDDEDEDEED